MVMWYYYMLPLIWKVKMKIRCEWCTDDPLYQAYHDEEWGVPVHDDRQLYGMLILEGAQAGLSWLTVLKKRENYRKLLHDFDYQRIAGFSEHDLTRLLSDPGIIRNRLKVTATVKNARATLGIIERYGSLDAFLWQYVKGTPVQNSWRSITDVPARTHQSDAMSRDLKRLGFSFVGSTICYAFMQAVGMVNDHTVDCFRHRQLAPA